MPHYLAIGVTKQEILHSGLVELRVYDDAYQLKRKMQDERDYFCGIYFYEAVSIALANAFRKKGSKPAQYREKPIMDELEDKRKIYNPTEEEKIEQTQMLFDYLESMQRSFERSHGVK